MATDYTYKEYASSRNIYKSYSDYQKRYSENIRESDKVLIKLVEQAVAQNQQRPITLLDVGCSTGNLLFHIRNLIPELKLYGGDLMEPVIAECQNNHNLEGIEFRVIDILNFNNGIKFDVIVINAVLFLFDSDLLEQSLANISQNLNEGGQAIIFDFCHNFYEELKIIEKSSFHPDGLPLHFRSQETWNLAFKKCGFSQQHYFPFEIGIDLAKPEPVERNGERVSDIGSYTVMTHDNHRLLFRGALFQPWTHIVAQK